MENRKGKQDMEIEVINKTEEKRAIIEKCDSAFLEPLSSRDNYEAVFSKIDKYAIFIAAYENNVPVGYAAIYANDKESKTAFISMIGVLEEAQGKHIGSALMKKCVEKAIENDMKNIRLEVLNTNEKAIRFYKHHGFEYEKKCSDTSNHLIKKIA